jgi:hypothetical protein
VPERERRNHSDVLNAELPQPSETVNCFAATDGCGGEIRAIRVPQAVLHHHSALARHTSEPFARSNSTSIDRGAEVVPRAQHEGVAEPVRAGAALGVRREPIAPGQGNSARRARAYDGVRAGSLHRAVEIAEPTLSPAQQERPLDLADDAVHGVSKAMRLQVAVVEVTTRRQ